MADKTIEYYRAAAEAARNGHETAMKYAEEHKKLAEQYRLECTNLENLNRARTTELEDYNQLVDSLQHVAKTLLLISAILFVALIVCIVLLST